MKESRIIAIIGMYGSFIIGKLFENIFTVIIMTIIGIIYGIMYVLLTFNRRK